MITCGNTSLTNALPHIINIVGKSHVAQVLYQRQKSVNPKMQSTSFKEDMAYLKRYFSGKSLRIGPDNHHYIDIFYSNHASMASGRNATLQLAMHDLDTGAMNNFCCTSSESEIAAKTISGLDSIFPDASVDRYFFSPSGYSMNGISGTNYFAVHVTPQADSSYASFETNFTGNDYSIIIKKLISLFSPASYFLTLTTSLKKNSASLHSSIVTHPAYIVAEKRFNVFDCGSWVTFLSYTLI